MSPGRRTPQRQCRLRFENGFDGDARSNHHHLTYHDVERAIRWPRSVDVLTDAGTRSERIAVWLAKPPAAMPEPSSVLVITREHHNARLVQDAWRIYQGDIDLSRLGSARDAFAAFLDRYGLDLQMGRETGRLILDRQIPMGPSSNTAAKLPAAAADVDVRTLQILRLVPETAIIEVSIAYAINETAVRLQLAQHEARARKPVSHASTDRHIGVGA